MWLSRDVRHCGDAQYTTGLMKHREHASFAARSAPRDLFPCTTGCRHATVSDSHLDRTAGLLAMVRERMRTRHLALRTEQAYLRWLQRYVDFHDGRDPHELGASEVEQFLRHLALHRKVSAATQNQALQALLFLYRHVLDIEPPWLDGITRAAPERKLPVVLSRVEVRALLAQILRCAPSALPR